MKKRIDYKLLSFGDKFNRLSFVRLTTIKHSNWYGIFNCECGNTKEMPVFRIVVGDTKSCGCLFREKVGRDFRTHKKSLSKLYKIWLSIKSRCFCIGDTSFHNYGGRGISICQYWQYDFEAFEQWAIKNGYGPKMQLDRINNNGNYTPLNCRFVDSFRNQRNTRKSVMINAFGITKSLPDWSEDPRCVVSYKTLKTRISKRILTPEACITTPIKDYNK